MILGFIPRKQSYKNVNVISHNNFKYIVIWMDTLVLAFRFSATLSFFL